MKCKKGLEISVLKSGAGYYLGTLTEDGLPNCRISRNYTDKKESIDSYDTDRMSGCIENEWCNKTGNCFGG